MRPERGQDRCHFESCVLQSEWRIDLEIVTELRSKPVQCDGSIHVCDAHVDEAIVYTLSDANKKRIEKTFKATGLGQPKEVEIIKTPVRRVGETLVTI